MWGRTRVMYRGKTTENSLISVLVVEYHINTNIVALNNSNCLDNILQCLITVLVAEYDMLNTNIVTNKKS